MIDDKIIEAVTTIASEKRRRKFPLQDAGYHESDVRIICESLLELSLAILKKKKPIHILDKPKERGI